MVVSIVQDIFKVLAQNDLCRGPLEERLLPTLVSILQSADKVPLGLPVVSTLDDVYIIIFLFLMNNN